MVTIKHIGETACQVFGVKWDDLTGKKRGDDNLMAARHCAKTLAFNMEYSTADISDALGGHRTTVNNSIKVINDYGQFCDQYALLKEAVDNYMEPPEETPPPLAAKVQYDDNGIQRVTQEEYDERFYGHTEKINTKTGNHWFPAFHYLWHLGAPMSPFLVSWYKEYGHEADRIMKHKEQLGSFVHDRIENMTKYKLSTTTEMIENFCRMPSDILFVKRCFDGFMNFMRDHDAVVVSSEKMILAGDWGGTLDLELRIKDDGWKNVWCIDLKTSKSVFEDHLIQVECYRRVCGADRGGVLILGNSTKKRYTFTEVPVKKQDLFYAKFMAVKETAYITMLDRGTIAPTVEVFPVEFKLNPESYEIGDRLTSAVPVQEAGDGSSES